MYQKSTLKINNDIASNALSSIFCFVLLLAIFFSTNTSANVVCDSLKYDLSLSSSRKYLNVNLSVKGRFNEDLILKPTHQRSANDQVYSYPSVIDPNYTFSLSNGSGLYTFTVRIPKKYDGTIKVAYKLKMPDGSKWDYEQIKVQNGAFMVNGYNVMLVPSNAGKTNKSVYVNWTDKNGKKLHTNFSYSPAKHNNYTPSVMNSVKTGVVKAYDIISNMGSDTDSKTKSQNDSNSESKPSSDSNSNWHFFNVNKSVHHYNTGKSATKGQKHLEKGQKQLHKRVPEE